MSKTSSSQARWIGVIVFLLTVSFGEFAALILNYQNNFYLRQYVSDNLSATIVTSVGLLVFAAGVAYLISKVGGTKSPGPHVPVFARIGSFVGRRYKLIIVFWILLFAVSLPLSQQLSQVVISSTSGGQSSSSESARAQNLMAQEFPHPQANTSAIILLQGSDVADNATKRFTLDLEKNLLVPGVLNSVENFTSIYSIERAFLIVYYVQNGSSYSTAQSQANQTLWSHTLSNYPVPIPPAIRQNFISPDNKAMIIVVSFSKSPGSFGKANTDPILKNVVTMRDIISQLKASDGGPAQTYVTGDLATTADSSIGSDRDLGLIEPVTVGAILILAGLFFFAIATPFVPLTIVGMALLIAEGGLYMIGKYIVPIQDTTTTFLFTIMLGVGTDYSIFLMARYREERVEAHEKAQAVQTSVTWSGESIATSATTVIIAFGAMTISSFTLLQSIGVGLGFGVLIALLVSLTLIPSFILIAGDRIFWPRSGKRFESYAVKARKRRAERPGYFRRAASFSVKRPALVLGLTVLISIPAIYISLTGSTSYDFTAGLTHAESVDGLAVLEKSFGAGQIGPTQVLVQFPGTILVNGNLTKVAQSNLETLSQSIGNLSNVKVVTGPTRPNGVLVNATNMKTVTAPQDRLAILGDIGKDNRTALVTVLFVDEPFTQRSLDTVSQIRSLVGTLRALYPSLAQDSILVGGASASTLDFSSETVGQFNTMRLLTVSAIFLVLLVVLGSYPLAITGILSIGLSITWAYAATLLFFNNVLQSGVLFIIPLVLFLLLYGIGMDYNIFILTRIREEAQKGKETRQAVVDAVDRTGGIITALALILAGALGSLLLSSNRLLEGFGFAIALAVVLDAMVVRTYLVPAIMSVLGQRAWWGPNRLRRVRFDKKNETPPVSSQSKK
jgi:putative drug exporter of the RND superfamily